MQQIPAGVPLLFLLSGDRFLFALAGTGIGPGTLSSEGQPLAMPQSPVTANIHEPLDVEGNLSAQAAFHLVVAFNNLPQFIEFFLGQIIDKPQGIDLRLFTNFIRAGPADTVNVSQRDVYVFIREVNSHQTRHINLYLVRQAAAQYNRT
jgi:hypothetical protein